MTRPDTIKNLLLGYRQMSVVVQQKQWYYSKTIWANVLTVIIAILLTLANEPSIPQDAAKWVLMIQGMLNIVLRFLTDQPINVGKE